MRACCCKVFLGLAGRFGRKGWAIGHGESRLCVAVD